MEIPSGYWKSVETAWRASQTDEGGWPYRPNESRNIASMTAAGTATLYITYDNLHASDERDIGKSAPDKHLASAIAWIGKYFAPDQNMGYDRMRGGDDTDVLDALLGAGGLRQGTYIHYMLFGFERAGEASGLTRFRYAQVV